MATVCWHASSTGSYWIDIALGDREERLMIDLGLVDRRWRQGFEVEPSIYDQLEKTGQFSHVEKRSRRDAGGRMEETDNGLTYAQLIDPFTRQRVGPQTSVYVSRGTRGVPSRVGVVFFHRLAGCRVIWDLDNRTWCIEYP